MKPYLIGAHFKVGLTVNKQKINYFLFKLVVKAFIKNDNNEPLIGHIDRNKQNN